MTAKTAKTSKKTTRITEPAADTAEAPAPEGKLTAKDPDTAVEILLNTLGVAPEAVTGIDIRENVIRIHGKDRSARSIKRGAK